MQQRIMSPTPQDAEFLEAHRTWVRAHLQPDSQHRYAELDQKLQLIDDILSGQPDLEGDHDKLIALARDFRRRDRTKDRNELGGGRRH